MRRQEVLLGAGKCLFVRVCVCVLEILNRWTQEEGDYR